LHHAIALAWIRVSIIDLTVGNHAIAIFEATGARPNQGIVQRSLGANGIPNDGVCVCVRKGGIVIVIVIVIVIIGITVNRHIIVICGTRWIAAATTTNIGDFKIDGPSRVVARESNVNRLTTVAIGRYGSSRGLTDRIGGS